MIDYQKRCRLLNAVGKLRLLRQYAETMPLPELLHTIVDVLQLEPLLAAQEFGLEKLANIKKLIALAESYTIEKHGTLADYLLRTAAAASGWSKRSSCCRYDGLRFCDDYDDP